MTVTPSVIRDVVPAQGLKVIAVELETTVDDGDTFDITLADYGASVFLGVIGFIHTTENSVVVQEQPTTAVSSGVLTVTVGGSTDDKKRFYVIYAR